LLKQVAADGMSPMRCAQLNPSASPPHLKFVICDQRNDVAEFFLTKQIGDDIVTLLDSRRVHDPEIYRKNISRQR
jgi:hypothetical protein